MKELKLNWISEGTLDFEYKKYLLLAYLKEINKNFNYWILYPFLNDLLQHYQNLVTIRDNKQQTVNQFPKKLSKLDFENFTLEYQSIMEDDKYLEVIEAVVDYAIPLIQGHLNTGTEMYDTIEDGLEIYPVGLVPLNKEEGYMFLSNGSRQDTEVYNYAITLFEGAEENFRGIRTNLIYTFSRSISTTYESVKMELIRQHAELPNPATFAVESNRTYPIQETLLPIAKRSLVKLLSAA